MVSNTAILSKHRFTYVIIREEKQKHSKQVSNIMFNCVIQTMDVEITSHARERMRKYNIPEDLVLSTLNNPTSILQGYDERKVYQKKINGYVIRVITEETKGIKTCRIITVYKAKSGRYEIQI
jgi:hypothetical protein